MSSKIFIIYINALEDYTDNYAILSKKTMC